MTNILQLPQIVVPTANNNNGTTITIAHNADWRDQFFVGQPGTTGGLITGVTGNITVSSNTVTSVSSLAGLVPGMVIAGYGIPTGTTFVITAGNLVLSANATISASGIAFTIYPPPLDLTGIRFSSELRTITTNPQILLQMSTSNGLMVNSGASGLFGWNVLQSQLPALWPSSLYSTGSLACVVDITAYDNSPAAVDLCASGPIPVTVNLAVTR